MIAASHPIATNSFNTSRLSTTYDQTTNQFYTNNAMPSTAPPTIKKANSETLNTLNNADNNIVTSLPPIISGKRIKLPLGQHRYL